MTGLAGEQLVRDLRSLVNTRAVGQPLSDVPSLLAPALQEVAPGDRDIARAVIAALEDALVEQIEERVVLAGTANLARARDDFPLSIGPVLEALEEHVVLLKLMGSMATLATDDAVAVSIGSENPHEGLRSASMVTANYGPSGVGGLGVVGPTRMDYPMAMASVRAVAHYVSQLLEN